MAALSVENAMSLTHDGDEVIPEHIEVVDDTEDLQKQLLAQVSRLDDSCDSDELSSRMTELAASSFDSSSSQSLGTMTSAVRAPTEEARQSTVDELERMGFGHLAALADVDLASTAPVAASVPLAEAGPSALSLTCPMLPSYSARRPGELMLPSSDDSRTSSVADGRSPLHRCTPVLRRARMQSPDEEAGVMMLLPEEREQPGDYARRRRPWRS